MPKSVNIIDMKKTVCESEGSELNNEMIRFFIPGSALIDLRGRSTRSVRSGFNYSAGMGVNSTIDTRTTEKSSQFHLSLR